MYDIFVKPIDKSLAKLGISKKVMLLNPPNLELGDFCIVINPLAGDKDPAILGKELVKTLAISGISEITTFTTGKKKGRGITYLNFKVETEKKFSIQKSFIKDNLQSVFNENYGFPQLNKGKSAIVEHTSANPISPLHVGNVRNSVLGDTLARILERSGYKVYRHFYVNDVGLQVSFVVVGYEILRNQGIRPNIKVDLWLGQVYAIMNCLYTIQTIKIKGTNQGLELNENYSIDNDELSKLNNFYQSEIDKYQEELDILISKDNPAGMDKKRIRELKRDIKKVENDRGEVDKYKNTFTDLQSRFSQLFDVLLIEVGKIDLVDKQTQYLQSYENKTDDRIVGLFREVTQWILDAFIWTLRRYNIEFDQFDYESDISWSGLPKNIIDKLAKSEFASSQEGESVRLTYPKEAISKLLEKTGLTKKDIPIKGNIPDLQLRRSNGTSLYAAKDIAYSIQKFEDRNPDVVYNVISTEQTLPQFQLLLPLVELGYYEYARNMKHYAYELVELSGRPMSGRMATYVTADAFYDETFIRSRMAKRQSDAKRDLKPPKTSSEWKTENTILHAVTLASTRYPLIDKTPKRRIVLDIDQELDFKRNPGPFIQYAHARCCGIIKKAGIDIPLDAKIESLVDEFNLTLVKHLISLDELIEKSIGNLDPSIIATWCFQLASFFMKFYERYPVLKAENEEIKNARLLMIYAIKQGIHTGLDMLGIPSTEKL